MFITLLKILVFATAAILAVRFIAKTSIPYALMKRIQSMADSFYSYQTYKVPQFNENLQENQLYKNVEIYLQSLPAMEDSDCANLITGAKSNEIKLHLDTNQTVTDSFLGYCLTWTNSPTAFLLRIRRNDKRLILRPYLQHIHTIAEELDQRKKELRLYINRGSYSDSDRWQSVPLTHPATLDTISMDPNVKNRVKSDLEQFVKSKQYYHRLGRVWKRSYLLYGPSGTGKSSFVAAMSKLLGFHVYDVDLSNVADDSDLKLLISQTSTKSIILIEDLDRFLNEIERLSSSSSSSSTSRVTLTGLLNFMDGLASSCGEDRVMVFTVNSKEKINQSVLRPGRIDVHIHFPLCDFSTFKTLANSHLGLKEHKLFPQVDEIIHSGASLSPAAIGELMLSNRSSPSRALKSVITALQTNAGEGGRVNGSVGHRRLLCGSRNGSDLTVEPEGLVGRESVQTVREFRKLYGLLRIRSRKDDLNSSLSEVGSVDKGL